MGEPVVDNRWSDARKKQLRDSRVVGTRALVDALRDLPRRPRLLISASGVELLRRSRRRDPDGERGGRDRLPGRARRATGRPRRCAPPTSGCASSCCATASCCRRRSGILRKILTPFRLGLGGTDRQRRPVAAVDSPGGSHRARSGTRCRTRRCRARSTASRPSRSRTGSSRARWARCWGGPTVLKAPLFALRLRYGSARGRGAAGEPARDAGPHAGDGLRVPPSVAARGARRGRGQAPARRGRRRGDHDLDAQPPRHARAHG